METTVQSDALRRRRWFLILFVTAVLLVTDVLLADLPGPVPTQQAINNVEHDPAFLSLARTRVIQGQTINGTYYYMGYSNDPRRDFSCVNNLYSMWIHNFNPFHEYSTTTLIFAVELNGAQPVYGETYVPLLFNLFIQVNPNTGQILSIDQEPQCA